MIPRFSLVVISLSCAAYSGLFTMPLWIGGLTDDLHVSSAVPGYMGSVQLLCSMLTSLWVSLRIASLNPRQVARWGVGLIFVANAGSAVAPDIGLLFLARAVSGAGEGLLLAALNTVISRSAHADRYFALSQTAIASFGIALFAIGPPTIRAHGAAAVFAIVAAVALLSAAGLVAVPTESSRFNTRSGMDGSHLNATALTALAFVFIGCQGAWAYMERLGVEKLLSIEQIGRCLIVGQLIGLLGPISSNRFAQRGGRRAAIVMGLMISAAATLVASQSGPSWMFAIGAAGFQFGTMFIVTSYLGYLASIDPAGQNAAAAPAFINLGSALGPASMAGAVSIAGYPVIGWLVPGLYVLAVMLLFRRIEARAHP